MKRKLTASALYAAAAALILVLCSTGIAVFLWGKGTAVTPHRFTATVLNPLDNVQNGVTTLLKGSSENDDYFAATYFPTLTGAKGNGVQDDTQAIAESLEEAKQTGGTVYLPQGIYRISGTLRIPANVTLRGDFSAPDSKQSSDAKTVLLVSESAPRDEPLLTLEEGAALIGVTVEYEAQSPQQIIPYPETILCEGGTLQRIALINSYRGICLSGNGKSCLSEIWISPLNYGILIRENRSEVILEDISISPSFWLNHSPEQFREDGLFAAMNTRLHGQMEALTLENVRDIRMSRIRIEGAAVGLRLNVPQKNDGLLLAEEITVSASNTPVQIQSLPETGMCLSNSTFRPENDTSVNCIEIGPDVQAPIQFTGCNFAGLQRTVIQSLNSDFISFYHCSFGTWWDTCFDVMTNTFLAISPIFKSTAGKASLGLNAFGLLYDAEELAESWELLFSVPKEESFQTELYSAESLRNSTRGSENQRIYNVTEYGIRPEEEDNSEALLQLFDRIGNRGGIVFFPEGTYRFSTYLTVPEKVRLIGAGTRGRSTTLHFCLLKSVDHSLIELKENASVEQLRVTEEFQSADSQQTYAVSSLFGKVRILDTVIEARRGIRFSGTDGNTVERTELTVDDIGIGLRWTTNTKLKNLTVQNRSGAAELTGIRITEGSVILSGARITGAKTAIHLTEGTSQAEHSFQGMLTVFRENQIGLFCETSGDAVLTDCGFAMESGTSATLLNTGEAMTGTLSLQSAVCTLSSDRQIETRGGTLRLRAAIFSGSRIGTSVFSENGDTSLIGCIWKTQPELHADCLGGNVTLSANLLQSDRVFAGTEENYLQTQTAGAGTVSGDSNLIHYIYITAEENGQESGSE